jgi:riboflavin kinase/FMN adenylyltransferase
MELHNLHMPKLGVYAVDIQVLDGAHQGQYHGVANLGIRPMFERATPNLETHLFDFQGDLYGATLSVGLVEFLRGEAKFNSLEALIAQMNTDSTAARTALAAT